VVSIDKAFLDAEEVTSERRTPFHEQRQKLLKPQAVCDAVEFDKIAFGASARENVKLHAGVIFDRCK
jgi:hypothetical protein